MIRDALADACDRLTSAGVDSARNDAEILLAHVLRVARPELTSHPNLDAAQSFAYEVLLDRRAAREPLQHLTGSTGFRYLDVEVGPGVFVPRPETEVMTGVAVDELRRLVSDGVGTPRAVDLCTGSGAIALALATEVPGTRVTGVEVAPEAYAYAVRNARLVESVDMRLGDIAGAADDLAGTVHVVTANPPYIPLGAFESVAVEVRDFDPPVALWSGEDGLDAITVVAGIAARLLVDDGLVVCEHADVQGQAAQRVFAETGQFRQVRDHHDLAGRSRFVSARRVSRSVATAGTIAL